MDSITLQGMVDHARAEMEAAEARERDHIIRGRLLHTEAKGKRETHRLLVKELCSAQQVRNTLILEFATATDRIELRAIEGAKKVSAPFRRQNFHCPPL
jgi:hypothetical protein